MTDLAIQTTGLTRHFGDVRAVDDLSLHVESNSIYAFLGPNGAGKTTTIRMVLGLTRPDRGEIHVLGQALNRANLRRIGAMVEAPSLYPHLTGYENLQVTQRLIGLHKSKIERVLQIVRMQNDAQRLVKTYSQGMRQRLGLALSLVASPDLLILDEPTNGLDPAGTLEMRELIRHLPAEHGITVFLSSHLLGEVEQMATHVGIVGRGRLLFEGTLDNFQSRQRARVVIEVDRPSAGGHLLRQAGYCVQSVNESGVTVEIGDRTDTARVAAVLVGAGLNLYQLYTPRPSLEDLFLDLTKEANLGSPSTVEVIS